MFEIDVEDQMIKKTQEAINTINNKIENMSEGQKKMYIHQKSKDLFLLNSKFSTIPNKAEFIFDIIKDINDDIKDF